MFLGGEHNDLLVGRSFVNRLQNGQAVFSVLYIGIQVIIENDDIGVFIEVL
jgi:hypothetical protein